LLRLHRTEIAIAASATVDEEEGLREWWEEYLRPYGGGATIPAKIVRLPEADARAAIESLVELINAACSTCGTTPLAINETTLTIGCPQCGEPRYVSLPRGFLQVGRKRTLTPEEEMKAAWASRENR
jgi:hypothetical protein